MTSSILSCVSMVGFSFQAMTSSPTLSRPEAQACFVVREICAVLLGQNCAWSESFSVCLAWAAFCNPRRDTWKDLLVCLKPAHSEWERLADGWSCLYFCYILVGNSEVWISCEQVRTENPAFFLFWIIVHSEMKKLLPFDLMMWIETKTQTS